MSGLLYPPSAIQILQYWPNFIDFSEERINQLLEAIHTLTSVGKYKGYVNDEDIINNTGHIITATADAFIFEGYTFNRWRAAWMNHAGTVRRRNEWREEKEAASAAAAQRKTAKVAKAKAASEKRTISKEKKVKLIKP